MEPRNVAFAALVLKKIIAGEVISETVLRNLPAEVQSLLQKALIACTTPEKLEANLKAQILAEGKVELLEALARADPTNSLDDIQCGWQVLNISNAMEPLEKRRQICDPLLAIGETLMVFGGAKRMKSLFMLALALSVATGKKFLSDVNGAGGFSVCQMPVVWIDLEAGRRRMAERVSAFIRGIGGESEKAPFFIFQFRNPGRTFRGMRVWFILKNQLLRLKRAFVLSIILGQVWGRSERTRVEWRR